MPMPNEEKMKGVAGAVSAVAEAIASGEGAPSQPPIHEGLIDATAELTIIEKAKEFGKKVAQNIVQAEKDLIKEGAHTAKDLAVVLKNPDVIELTKGITAEAVDQNPHLAAFLSDIAHASENLKNNPYFWLQEGTRLRVWSMRSDLPREVHADTSAVLRKVGIKIAEFSQTHPDFDVPNWAVQHGISEVARTSMVPVPDQQPQDIVNQIFDETGADTLAGTRLEEPLQKYKQFLKYDIGELHDTHKISEYIQQIKEIGYKEGLPAEQVKTAVERLQSVIDRTKVVQQRQEYGDRYIFWDEIKNQVPPGISHNGDPYPVRYLRHDDIQQLKSGKEEQWFYSFMDSIYGFSKEQAQASLADQSKWEEFEGFIKWKYGDSDSERFLEPYRVHWNERRRHQFIINGLLYQPGDIKDRLRSLRMMTGSDLDYYYKNFKHANLASSFYDQAVMDLMADKRSKRETAIAWLKAEQDNPLYSEKDAKGNLRDPHKDPLGKKKIARDELYKLLKEKNAEPIKGVKPGEKQFGTLTGEQQRLMYEIKAKIDLVGEGVMLWDSDVQSYTELHMEIHKMHERESMLLEKRDKAGLTETEANELKEISGRVAKKMEVYKQQLIQQENYNAREDLNALRGLSPIDIEVRERLIAFLKSEGIEYKEEDVRMALWAARQASVGSGHMVAIGSFMAIAPDSLPDDVIDRGLENVYRESGGKYVMRAPAFEDLQRFYNPELFAKRFTFGGEMGTRARDILRLSHMKEKGFKLTRTKEWAELWKRRESHETKEQKLVRATIEVAEKEMGISFTELLGPGFFSGGGDYDATSWRLEKGMLDQLRLRFLDQKAKFPDSAILDNQALGIQLLVAKSPEEKLAILDRMMRRKPTVLFQIVGDARDEVFAKHNIAIDTDWLMLKRSLSLAEMKLWKDKSLLTSYVDLGSEKDFQTHVVPFLEKFGADPKRYHDYFETVHEFQEALTKDRKRAQKDNAGSFRPKHETLLKAVANGEYPMTLSLSDFDWSESNFFQLGAIAMDRRGRDNEAMAHARDIMLNILSQTEFLSPNDPMETIKQLKDLRGAVNTYADSTTAEKVVKETLRVFLEFNKLRNVGKVLDWIPGMTGLLRKASEIEPEHIPILTKLKPWHNFLKKNHMVGQKIAHLPHTIAEAISYSIRYTGEEGNYYDEKKIANLLATAQDNGLFTENPQFVGELRREFKAGFGGRFIWLLRKYWWVVIFATIAYAALEETQEKKGH